MIELMTLTYYADLRGAGLTLKDAAALLGKSIRTVTKIAQRLKTDFFAPENEIGLARQIELLLTARPARLAEIIDGLGAQALDPRDDVETALAALVEEGRARRINDDDGARFEVATAYVNLGPWANPGELVAQDLGIAVADTDVVGNSRARLVEQRGE